MAWSTDFQSANFHSLKNGLFNISCSRYNNDAKLFVGNMLLTEETLELSHDDGERVSSLIEWADGYIECLHLNRRAGTLDDLKDIIKQLLPSSVVKVDNDSQVYINTNLYVIDKGVLKKA